MRIKDIGGEFALIAHLSKLVAGDHPDVVVGIGDDAAVLNLNPGGEELLLLTTDTLVEDDHFKRCWSTPAQIGLKAAEINLSDIAAMGGVPSVMLVTLVLTRDATVEWTEQLYQGLASSCQTYGVAVVGGDVTHGAQMAISVALLGRVKRQCLCLRSHAHPGDLIAVTGPLGASAAGLHCLRENIPVPSYLLQKHVTPRCRLDAVDRLAPLVNAMIDISDGLASEINHICDCSGVGAMVEMDKIPLHPEVRAVGAASGIPPTQFALGGGEDYELLFTLPPARLDQLRASGLTFHVIGQITEAPHQRHLVDRRGRIRPLQGGYNHFGI